MRAHTDGTRSPVTQTLAVRACVAVVCMQGGGGGLTDARRCRRWRMVASRAARRWLAEYSGPAMRRPFCQRRTDQTGLPPGDSLSRSRLFARSGAVIRVVITCASHQHAWNPSSSLSTSTMSPSFHSSSGGSVVGGRWRDGAGERAVSGIRPGPGPLPTTTIPCALDATLLSSFVPLRSSSPRARSLEAQDHHPCANLLPARKLSDKNPGAWAVKRRARPHLCAARRAVPSRVGGGARRARAQRWHPGPPQCATAPDGR